MVVAEMAFREVFVEQFFRGSGDLEQLLVLALIALILFRSLSMVADAVVGVVSQFVRVMVGALVPVLFILLLVILFLLL